ncbi:MAG: hypothetical protein JNK65_03600, partial [Deltaproteobacteria bacterium]|nr:hypothetical protein [Deltaproteobacteria bacterium]
MSGDSTKIHSSPDLKPQWDTAQDPQNPIVCHNNCHQPLTAPKKNLFFMADVSLTHPLKTSFKSSLSLNPEIVKWIQESAPASDPKKETPSSETLDEATIQKFKALISEYQKKFQSPGVTPQEKISCLQIILSAHQRLGNAKEVTEIRTQLQFLLKEQGLIFEKRSTMKGLVTKDQLEYLQQALSYFKAAQDLEKTKSTLQSLQSLYQTQGNEVGKAYVGAELQLLSWDPKTNPQAMSEALKTYQKLDTLLRTNPQSTSLSDLEIGALRTDVQQKIYAIYLKQGEWKVSEGRYVEAEKDLFEALMLQPSKPFLNLYLSVAQNSGLLNFKQQDADLLSLEFHEMRQSFQEASSKKTPCVSHHQAPSELSWARVKVDPQIKQKITDQKKQILEGRKRFEGALFAVYGEPQNPNEIYERDLLKAGLLEKLGRPQEAEVIYQKISSERKDSKEPQEMIRKAMADHRLIAFSLSRREWSKASTQINHAEALLKNIPEGSEKSFLNLQLKMLQSEKALGEGQIQIAQSTLESALSLPVGEAGSAQNQMAARIRLKLSQIYYSKKESFAKGDAMVASLKSNFAKESEIVCDAFFTKALTRVATGASLEALQIIRDEIQKTYPQSSVSLALEKDPRFSKFMRSTVDAQGRTVHLLKEASEINEKDWGEAFKVALAKSGEGPTERKVAYGASGAAGVIAALYLAPEPVATKVAATAIAIGVGVGLLWERLVSVSEHTNEISDAYRTGLSPISTEEHLLNLCMFGFDVAMLVSAGMAGSVVKG